VDTLHRENFLISTVGYDAGMRINNLRQLCDWAQDHAAASLAGLPAAQAATAVEDIAGVIWRHAFGQGLRPGDDWGWILDQYDAGRIAAIVAESTGTGV